jgi:hypothetical protein
VWRASASRPLNAACSNECSQYAYQDYVALDGQLRVIGDQELDAGPGSMFTAPRGHRHGFSNPDDAGAVVLGISGGSSRSTVVRFVPRTPLAAEYSAPGSICRTAVA